MLGEKYAKTVSEKCVYLMADMADFKMENGIEATTDKLGKMIAEVKKLNSGNNLDLTPPLPAIIICCR